MADKEEIQQPVPISPFDRIKHVDDAGEYWSARELAGLIGYQWKNFEHVIAKARIACQNSGNPVENHFVTTTRTIEVGKGAKRQLTDVHLSRYACYLIIENADPEKEIIALGQTYFAIRTRRDELAQEREEALQRIAEREKLKRYHKELHRTARGAGVITAHDFAIFQDHGYKGLYQETAQEIAQRKGLQPGQNISDFMGITETAANGFRAALAREMLITEGVKEGGRANVTHHRAGGIVRKALEEAGVPPPEQLPTPQKSIQQLKRELARQQRIEEEDRLGLFAELLQDDKLPQEEGGQEHGGKE
jgi:DNA-damage-inducible protein D